MYIELEAGAILKLANNSNTLDTTGEIVVNQGTSMPLNDFSIRGTYSGSTVQDLCVRIDGVANPNTFKWGMGLWEPDYDTTGVAITGDWQSLAGTGLEIKFNALTGHAINNLWIVCFDGEECYGIRVGSGFHTDYINNVIIFGDGTIDLNHANQYENSLHAKNLPSNILVHGRCRGTIIEGLTLINGHRPIMVYGDNDGTYGANGAVTGGEEFNPINTKIINNTVSNAYNTYACGGAILLGHPEHRGFSYNVVCNLNNITSYLNGVEPNFKLYCYEVRNNKIRTTDYAGILDISLWRGSFNGLILNNDANFNNSTAPLGWASALNYVETGNGRV